MLSMSTKLMRTGLFSSGERTIITVGLLIAMILGAAGGPFGPGTIQTTLYAFSSFGLVTAAMLLAQRHLRLGQTLAAAGMAILSIAEMLLWVGGRPGGPGYDAAFAGGVMFYVPALLLISLPKGLPGLVRVLGVLASLPWAVFSVQFLMGQSPSYADALATIGYALLSLTAIGWLVVLGRTAD